MQPPVSIDILRSSFSLSMREVTRFWSWNGLILPVSFYFLLNLLVKSIVINNTPTPINGQDNAQPYEINMIPTSVNPPPIIMRLPCHAFLSIFSSLFAQPALLSLPPSYSMPCFVWYNMSNCFLVTPLK